MVYGKTFSKHHFGHAALACIFLTVSPPLKLRGATDFGVRGGYFLREFEGGLENLRGG